MKTKETSGRRKRILLLADFAYASAKAVAAGVVQFVSARSALDLRISGGHPGNDDAHYKVTSGVDGIITCLGAGSAPLRNALSANPHCPVVFASVAREGIVSPSRRHTAAILCDHAAISQAAADLLLRHGLTEFGYVGTRLGVAGSAWDTGRREAFSAALATHGYTPRIYLQSGDDEDDNAENAALAAWLKALPKPCGLFVSYDMRAMRVLDLCRAVGISVPEQIQVVSVDNETWICDHTSPTLTSIEPDFEGCGFLAAAALKRLMDGESGVADESFGVRCVEQRMSTTDIHGSATRAVRARQYLHDHAAEPLGTARLTQVLGCSPRLLQLSYKTVFGRTLQEDIAETRLDLAKRLLAGGDVPVCDIPGRIGFTSPNYFMQFFKRHTGMTMLQWRMKHRKGGLRT